MKKSESIKNIAAALAKFQAEVRDPRKEADNPYFKSKYVTLDALVDCVRPVLAKHGLSFLQEPAGDGQNISVTTTLFHESGEWLESEPFVMKAAKVDPQGAGSAVTYGRRYTLQAILGVTWCEKDDDGNAASGLTAKPATPAKQAAPAKPIRPAEDEEKISRAERQHIVDSAVKMYGEDAKRKTMEILAFFGYKKTADVRPIDYPQIVSMICGKK